MPSLSDIGSLVAVVTSLILEYVQFRRIKSDITKSANEAKKVGNEATESETKAVYTLTQAAGQLGNVFSLENERLRKDNEVLRGLIADYETGKRATAASQELNGALQLRVDELGQRSSEYKILAERQDKQIDEYEKKIGVLDERVESQKANIVMYQAQLADMRRRNVALENQLAEYIGRISAFMDKDVKSIEEMLSMNKPLLDEKDTGPLEPGE